MKQIKEEIRKASRFNDLDKETLVDMLMVANQELDVTSCKVDWLDYLVGAYRDGDSMEHSASLHQRLKQREKLYSQTRMEVEEQLNKSL